LDLDDDVPVTADPRLAGYVGMFLLDKSAGDVR
jgi:hypothetical protein